MKVPENASSLLCLRCLLPTKRCSLKYLQLSLKRHLLSQSKLSSSTAKLREGNHSPHSRKMAITLTLNKKTLLLCFSQLPLLNSLPLLSLPRHRKVPPPLSLKLFSSKNLPASQFFSRNISNGLLRELLQLPDDTPLQLLPPLPCSCPNRLHNHPLYRCPSLTGPPNPLP